MVRSGVLAVSVLLLGGCLDFDKFGVTIVDSCPAEVPEDICAIEATNIDPATFRADSGSSLNGSSCGDGNSCIRVTATAGERSDVRSRTAGAISGACSAAVRIFEPTSDAWSLLTLTTDEEGTEDADLASRVEIAFRPGKVRYTAGDQSKEADIDETAMVDGLRIRWLDGAAAFDVLAGSEAVGCFTLEGVDLDGSIRVGVGLDATNDSFDGSTSTKFDDYGFVP
ncbi:MAG: hypothetical protein HOW73_27995 [Polyangiaceae bacterium]|nr:hypothetical protein [Polyangiaceae bacterium]